LSSSKKDKATSQAVGVPKIERRTSEQQLATHWQACIFKVGDDVRQDMLALQAIELFKRILEDVGLNLFLFPYRVVATSGDCGIIEVVPQARSRDQVGKRSDGTLYNYFISRYGPATSIEFQNARNNYLRSMAAYSVVSYILQIKDRHNGNMLIDDFGHIVHIDFGFIFDISPGGNFKFERAPFKLADEMIELLGGVKSETFKWYMQSSTQAYLACRQHMNSFITIVSLMMDTSFPCFTKDTIANLKTRFAYELSELDAAKHFSMVIADALSTLSSTTTYFYDVFQNWSNGIEF